MADTVYSLEHIQTVQEKLREFAKTPRTRFSKQQAVEAIIDDIEAALERHPYDEVAEKLKAWGIDIAAGSLKQYVNAYRREHSSDDVSSSRKRSGKKKAKKAASNKSAAQAQADDDKATNDDDENSGLKAASRSSGNRTKRASNRTPDGFLELAEDL